MNNATDAEMAEDIPALDRQTGIPVNRIATGRKTTMAIEKKNRKCTNWVDGWGGGGGRRHSGNYTNTQRGRSC